MNSYFASPIDKARAGFSQVSESIHHSFSMEQFGTWVEKGLGALVTLVIFIPLLRLAVMLIHRVLKTRLTPQGAAFLSKWLWRIGLVIIILTVLKQMGLDLVAVLGAAGIAGIAIGFAAQNSLSNVISGLFLMGERSVDLDDFIEVSGLSGTVETVGLLSVSLRTADNKQVRIPNETILKGSMVNYTRYPIRRHDFILGVPYSEEPQKVINILKKVLQENSYCLDDPDPQIVFSKFGNPLCEYTVGAWCRRQDMDALRNSLAGEIQEAFAREGMQFPVTP